MSRGNPTPCKERIEIVSFPLHSSKTLTNVVITTGLSPSYQFEPLLKRWQLTKNVHQTYNGEHASTSKLMQSRKCAGKEKAHIIYSFDTFHNGGFQLNIMFTFILMKILIVAFH
jgi:hypothetical protein